MRRNTWLLRRRWFRVVLPFGGVIVLLAGGGFAALETESARTYWDGVLWALSLMTTVGFIGATPTTAGGKAIAGLLMLLGFGFLATTTAAVASLFVREDEEPIEEESRAFEQEVLAELRALRERIDRLDPQQ